MKTIIYDATVTYVKVTKNIFGTIPIPIAKKRCFNWIAHGAKCVQKKNPPIIIQNYCGANLQK